MQPWSSSRGLWLAIGLLLDLSLHGQTAGGVKSAIRFDRGAVTNPIVITWPASPGAAYQVKAAPQADAAWEVVTPAPLLAASNLWAWRDAAGQRARFYQVVRLGAEAELNGRVTDAVTGLPLAGVAVEAGGLSAATDGAGYYTLNGLSAGAVLADFSADATAGKAPLAVRFHSLARVNPQAVTVRGFRPGFLAYTNTQVQLAGCVPTRLDFSLSPSDVGGLRLVLNWDANPRDLDAHLVTPAIEGTAWEVSYQAGQRGRTNAPPYAQLDVDRKDGFGPETITVARRFPGTYRFYVHNFTEEQGDSGRLRDSKAVVQIYGDQGLLQTLHVPTTGEGEYWDVCAIDGVTGRITAQDRIVGARPSAAGAAGRGRTLRAASSPPPVGCQWDFGDGTVSQEENPVKVYVQPGVYAVQLTASLAGFASGVEKKAGYITVWSPPVITRQPADQTVAQGTSATFTVAASGTAPLSYQWRKAGVDLPGQTGASLVLAQVQPADAGDYTVAVSNAAGGALSQPATLTVQTEPAAQVPGMVWIPAGTFTMGSPATDLDRWSDEGPQTVVTLRRGFWMAKCETTRAEYLSVMGSNPSHFTGDSQRPVEQVSWLDATNYCGRLTELERAAGRLPAGYVYRLPTEVEWEFACRAGAATRFSYGDDPNYVSLGDHAWCSENSGGKTHPTGQKLPNAWGLYDMQGNVWEWCQDWYADALPGGSVVDPPGPNAGAERVNRGGSWNDRGRHSRAANRSSYWPEARFSFLGFRPVLAQP